MYWTDITQSLPLMACLVSVCRPDLAPPVYTTMVVRHSRPHPHIGKRGQVKLASLTCAACNYSCRPIRLQNVTLLWNVHNQHIRFCIVDGSVSTLYGGQIGRGGGCCSCKYKDLKPLSIYIINGYDACAVQPTGYACALLL